MQYRGGAQYHGGCSVPWGIMSPHMYHDIPHGTEHPYGTHDIPHVHHDIPHGTQDIPHIYHDISHGTEHPTVLKISPTALVISPTVLNTLTVLSTPHGTAHTHYTG